MKKIIAIFLTLLLTVSAFTFIGCDDKKEDEINKGSQACQHEFSNWVVVKDPTCSKEGKQKHKCKKCGFVEEEIIPKLPHNFVNGRCTKCGQLEG